MLTGDETATLGNAFINGFSVLSSLTEARKNLGNLTFEALLSELFVDGQFSFLGYCPQEDALLPLLTGYEHLELFARLRGVPKDQLGKAS